MACFKILKNNFGRVLEHILHVNYQDSWNALDSKTLQLAAYYELKEYDALESLFQSFKAYLKREKSIPKNRKQNYLNLIKYTDILIRTNRRDKDKIQKLKDEVTHTPGIVSKLWLLQKIDEL